MVVRTALVASPCWYVFIVERDVLVGKKIDFKGGMHSFGCQTRLVRFHWCVGGSGGVFGLV